MYSKVRNKNHPVILNFYFHNEQVRLSNTVEEKDGIISRRESAVKTMTEELIKANDIIRKLQNDIRALNHKVI